MTRTVTTIIAIALAAIPHLAMADEPAAPPAAPEPPPPLDPAVFGPLDSPSAHARPTDLAQPRLWSHEYPYLDHPDITDAQDGPAFLPVRSLLLDDRKPFVLSPRWHAHAGVFAGGAYETNVHRASGAMGLTSTPWLGVGADFGIESRPPGEDQGNYDRLVDFAVHASALTRLGPLGTFPAFALESRLVLRPLGATTFVVENAFRYSNTPGFAKSAAAAPPSLITYEDRLVLALRHRFNDMMTMTAFYQLDAQLVDTFALQGKSSLYNRLLYTFGVDAEQIVARVEAKLFVEGGYRTSPISTSITPPDAFPVRAGAFTNITLPRRMVFAVSLAFQDLLTRENANYPAVGAKPLRFAGSLLAGWTPPRGTIAAYLEWLGEPTVIGTGRYRVEAGLDGRLRFGNAIAAGRLAYRRLDWGTALAADAQVADLQRVDHEYSAAAQLRWNPAGLGHLVAEYDFTWNISNCQFTDDTVATLAPCAFARHMVHLRLGFGM